MRHTQVHRHIRRTKKGRIQVKQHTRRLFNPESETAWKDKSKLAKYKQNLNQSQDLIYFVDEETGKKYKRLKYGNFGPHARPMPEYCPSCGVAKGNYHQIGCDLEISPVPGHKKEQLGDSSLKHYAKNRGATYMKNIIFAEHNSPLERYLKEERYKQIKDMEKSIKTEQDRLKFAEKTKEILAEPYSVQMDTEIGGPTKGWSNLVDEVLPMSSTASDFKLIPTKEGKAKMVPLKIVPHSVYPPSSGFKIGNKSILGINTKVEGKALMKFKPESDIIVDMPKKITEIEPLDIGIQVKERGKTAMDMKELGPENIELPSPESFIAEDEKIASIRSPVSAKRVKI